MMDYTTFLGNLPTPIVSVWDNTTWTLTSPDGSQVERYIVEFECSVRNITFVEKYMSVSASGGTGRVATSVSCFGGLGQLYRVKVWAVSGPSISRQPAVKVVNTGMANTVHLNMEQHVVCTIISCNDFFFDDITNEQVQRICQRSIVIEKMID